MPAREISFNRIGQFDVPASLIQQHFNHTVDLLPLFSGIVIYRAERRVQPERVRYFGSSKFFDPIPEGQPAPFYAFEFEWEPPINGGAKWPRITDWARIEGDPA